MKLIRLQYLHKYVYKFFLYVVFQHSQLHYLNLKFYIFPGALRLWGWCEGPVNVFIPLHWINWQDGKSWKLWIWLFKNGLFLWKLNRRSSINLEEINGILQMGAKNDWKMNKMFSGNWFTKLKTSSIQKPMENGLYYFEFNKKLAFFRLILKFKTGLQHQLFS